jgi:hypothetical protein
VCKNFYAKIIDCAIAQDKITNILAHCQRLPAERRYRHRAAQPFSTHRTLIATIPQNRAAATSAFEVIVFCYIE